ncbi:hypothetical protein AMATHDRAFT_49378 [Amanita thiersii Skay4041]|uniref:Uncharacterized protein n=1 Tax=Amanita thiersii Skay4041 TaxID=703135 RepID=A0A2A9NH12_9AGAR|nr:hypothetical protein AMATHDRAFT_49378 [Amanita thiersii Skay4041]
MLLISTIRERTVRRNYEEGEKVKDKGIEMFIDEKMGNVIPAIDKVNLLAEFERFRRLQIYATSIISALSVRRVDSATVQVSHEFRRSSKLWTKKVKLIASDTALMNEAFKMVELEDGLQIDRATKSVAKLVGEEEDLQLTSVQTRT